MTSPAESPRDAGLFSPAPARRQWLRALLVLTALELLSFGVFLRRLGFYHDDWVWLEILRDASGFAPGFKALVQASSAGVRTFATLLQPLWYSVAGSRPLPHQLLLLLLDLLGGLLSYLFFCRAGLRARVSLLCAALALIAPMHAATHFWFSDAPQALSQDMLWGSLLLHFQWLETRKLRWLVPALAVYFLSLLCYESVALFPLLLGVAVYGRRKSIAEAAGALAPFGLAAVAGIFWQRVASRALLHIVAGKSWAVSAPFILKTYRDGLLSLTAETARLCGAALLGSPWLLRPAPLLALAGSAVLGAWVLCLPRDDDGPRPEARLLGTLCAAAFVAAYAPYALSGNYQLSVQGVMSRTNGGGGIAAALALAWLLEEARGRRSPRVEAALLALVLAAFTAANWHLGRQWADAWTLEQDILSKMGPKVRALPDGSTVFLRGAPPYVGGTDVFSAHWSLGAALRLKAGRRELRADILPFPTLTPARDAYVYDYGKDALAPLDEDWQLRWGIASMKEGRAADAVDHYREALKTAPDEVEVLSNLCAALSALNRLDEAKNACDRALTLDPGRKGAELNLGVIDAKQGRLYEAADHFRAALRIDPNFDEARTNLQLALRLQGAAPKN